MYSFMWPATCRCPPFISSSCFCAQVRAHVEQQIGLIAEGKAQKDAVVRHTLEQFRQK
jgi:DNA topoisomerase IA